MRRCLETRVRHVKMLQSDWLLKNHWKPLAISRNHAVFQYRGVKIKNFHAAKNGKGRKCTTESCLIT